MGCRTRKNLWYDRWALAGVSLVVASLFILYTHFSKQTIKTPSDLEILQGKVLRYSFKDGYKGRHYYYIYFDGDNNAYQIPADFIGCFDKSNFEATVQAGDSLKVSFNKRFLIFSISDAHRSYLPVDATIERYNHSDLQLGLIMLAGGCVILIGRYLYKKQ